MNDRKASFQSALENLQRFFLRKPHHSNNLSMSLICDNEEYEKLKNEIAQKEDELKELKTQITKSNRRIRALHDSITAFEELRQINELHYTNYPQNEEHTQQSSTSAKILSQHRLNHDNETQALEDLIRQATLTKTKLDALKQNLQEGEITTNISAPSLGNPS
jgi:chromosome segregation ATPase